MKQVVFNAVRLPVRATGYVDDLMGQRQNTQWVEPEYVCPSDEDHGIVGQGDIVICYQCKKYWRREQL